MFKSPKSDHKQSGFLKKICTICKMERAVLSESNFERYADNKPFNGMWNHYQGNICNKHIDCMCTHIIQLNPRCFEDFRIRYTDLFNLVLSNIKTGLREVDDELPTNIDSWVFEFIWDHCQSKVEKIQQSKLEELFKCPSYMELYREVGYCDVELWLLLLSWKYLVYDYSKIKSFDIYFKFGS